MWSVTPSKYIGYTRVIGSYLKAITVGEENF